MLSQMQHIKGVLIPINRQAVNENTANQIRSVAKKVCLSRIMNEELGEKGIVEIDTSIPTDEPHTDILRFASGLEKLIKAEGVAELGLYGHLMATADTRDEPVVMRITVRDGKIFYQDAHITWSVEVPF